MNGAELITAERRRQIDEEGFYPDRDARYKPGTLGMAAICYATFACSGAEIREDVRKLNNAGYPPRHWPWPLSFWKVGADNSDASRVRELVKAGALIAAEIDRIKQTGNLTS